MDRLPDRDELAVERTHFAEDRTIMAMERTFAGWMRTAFAAIGIGLAFHVVFGAFDPPWLARAIATLFILAGGWLAVAAERRACRTLARLRPHQLAPPNAPQFKWLGWAVALGAVLLVAGLWVLNDGAVGR
ncbi:MAG TPA: DUF202 domain-containing protein [Croceibacterium sp.]|nr:DUF202 domain-containing protein [Croceibacterium sp.]